MAKFNFNWDDLKKKIKEEEDRSKTFEKDTRFWTPTKDDSGNSVSIIRFLPDMQGTPFVKFYSHSFDYMVDGVKKFWIKNCINTFGYDQECPICKKNMEYFNSPYESDKQIASKRKRKLNYISNILVIKNPNKPEDEGKVFLFKYGTKIFEKINKRMFPSEEDLIDDDFKEFIPFDLYNAADFKLKVKKQGDFPNYDDSAFLSKVGPLGNDKYIEEIMNKTYLLEEFIRKDQFPTNEETIRVLGSVLGISSSERKKEEKKETSKKQDQEDLQDFYKNYEGNEIETDKDSDPEISIDEDDIDEDEAFFESLR